MYYVKYGINNLDFQNYLWTSFSVVVREKTGAADVCHVSSCWHHQNILKNKQMRSLIEMKKLHIHSPWFLMVTNYYLQY